MAVKNSLNTYLGELLDLNNNALSVLEATNNAITSNEDSVKITLTNPENNETKIFTVPSFGYLKNAIQRLENTVSALTDVDTGNAPMVRLSDGSWRKIMTAKVPSEAPDVTTIQNITTFNFKSNWFFENFLNPMLSVTIDLSSQISIDTEQVMVQRYILDCDNQAKLDYFNSNWNGMSGFTKESFEQGVIRNKISFVLDDETLDLPPRYKRYTGLFDVIRIDNNGSTKDYILNTLSYTDKNMDYEGTCQLKVGDQLEVNTQPVTTRYEITKVDSSRNSVQLKLLEGFKAIKVGSNQLKYSIAKDDSVSVDIPVGINERCVIFIKPIDPDSKIPAAHWSPGTGFFTNSLTYLNDAGDIRTLQQFYQQNVIDIGNILLAYSNDRYPTVRDGIVPTTPVLNADDFRVVQINKQVTDTNRMNEINAKIADKTSLESKLANLSTQISALRTKIQTTVYKTDSQKKSDKDLLSTYISEQNDTSANYSGLVDEIQRLYSSTGAREPKYRVRGFWSVPDPKFSPTSGNQEIIQFKIRYRYLSSEGAANAAEEYIYTTDDGESRATFSNWKEELTKRRERVMGDDGVYYWDVIDTQNADVVNINQLDIPITKGEQVEIQIKSISEAGYPANPIESDWSNSIIIPFPDNLSTDALESVISKNNKDAAKNALEQDLISMGVREHVNSSFSTNDTYFAHSSVNIASGFLSQEQTPITLFDKLTELQNDINDLFALIGRLNIELKVTVLSDVDDALTVLKEGDTTYVSGGYYRDEVKKLDIDQQKGAIITKQFKLHIESANEDYTGLRLLSKLRSGATSMVPSTVSEDIIKGFGDSDESDWERSEDRNLYETYDNFIEPTSTSNSYYKEIGRYDLVPINLNTSDIIDFQIASKDRYQSAQCHRQVVYSRFRNIADTFDMYVNKDSNKNSDSADSGVRINYGKFDERATFTGAEYEFMDDDNIFGIDNSDNNINEVDLYNSLTASNINNIDDNERKLIFRLPKTWTSASLSSRTKALTSTKFIGRLENANLVGVCAKTNTKKTERLNKLVSAQSVSKYNIQPSLQAAYGYSDLGYILFGTDDDDKSYLTTHKIGYEEDVDRYFIGKNTCNSYLFMSPNSHADLQQDYRDVGELTSLTVPLLFQYRMEDYKGRILGDETILSTSDTARNLVQANIIGIDIWTGDEKPKQYDIVVYANYQNNSVIRTTDVTSININKALNDASNSLAKISATRISSSSVNSKVKRTKLSSK